MTSHSILQTQSLSFPSKVTIAEMGARDGLQNEEPVSLEDKIGLIDRLSESGLNRIEAGSFVSPKWVPQMADSDKVFAGIKRQKGVVYSALTPNKKGFDMAMEAGADQIAVFTSASEGFCRKNINCSIDESLKRFRDVIEEANHRGVAVRGYLSCVADCPYDGPTNPAQVARVAASLYEMGCYEISLGDTIGTGTPLRIARMIEAVESNVPVTALAVHFHDTWGQALANIYQALTMGISVVDSSVAGLGGCPYARGATGNVATEDVLVLCHGLGIETGVDLRKVAQAGWHISDVLNRVPSSRASLALR